MKYPKTRKDGTIEKHFNIQLADPYRWLEDDNSPETEAWVREQQALTESLLNEYPQRQEILTRQKEISNYQKQTCALKRGDWYYFSRNDGLQNQWVQYRKRTPEGEAEVFFDPNTLSEDGTTRGQRVGYSLDYKYFVYQISKAGADAGEFWVMETETKTWLDDKLLNMKHSGAAWYKDGYFYSRYDADESYQEQDKNQKVYYHKLGEKKEQDTLIYEDPEHPLRYVGAGLSDDDRYLFIDISEGTHGNSILYKSLEDEKAEFKCLFEGFDYNGYVMDSYEPDTFYLFTNKNAPNYKLMKANLSHFGETGWVEVIPQRDYLLDSVIAVGGKLIAFYIKDVQGKMEVLDRDGNYLYSIEMPYQGVAYPMYTRKEDTECYFSFNSFVRPEETYHYDIAGHKLTFAFRDQVNAEVQDIVSEQIFYPSKDGTLVPMTLVYKQGIVKNGGNPVYLHGYGGFNCASMPSFDERSLQFLDKGGIAVTVNLRGGGEYGESWHEAGMLLKKQNVFDDFIAAAEYLIKDGYTNPAKIAIAGGSNGGLLVGAVMLQRPDLFKVALPMMGVLDMLRYHKFTCGWGWMVEYGNPEEEEHFHNLLKYSPLHNVKEGVKYPATMVVTADHDDRVIPGHSFKFAATLQEKASPEQPVLLYTQIQSSHGSSSMTKSLELSAAAWAFVFKYLEI